MALLVHNALSNTDWKALRNEKSTLIDVAWAQTDSATRQYLLELVSWIGEIQEAAQHEGFPVEWIPYDEETVSMRFQTQAEKDAALLAAFDEIQNGTNPLTEAQIERLVKHNPRYKSLPALLQQRKLREEHQEAERIATGLEDILKRRYPRTNP